MYRKLFFIFSFFFLLLFNAVSSFAVTAEPKIHTLQQPDGNIIHTQLFGDEHYNFWETIDGYTIMKADDGWWTYAIKESEHKLISSAFRVGVDKPPMEKHIRIKPILKGLKICEQKANIPCTGNLPALIIMMEFTDQSPGASYTASYYNNLLFGGTQGTMVHFYDEISNEQAKITGEAVSNWVTSSQTMSYYGENGTSSDNANGYVFELAREAIELADTYVDFSQWDTNNNSVMDAGELHIILVHAGGGEESTGSANDLWSHRWYVYGSGYGFTDTYVDGIRISENEATGSETTCGYVLLAEDSPMGTFAHEFLHDIGAKDIYDTGGSVTTNIGEEWTLMDRGSWNGSPSGSSPAHPDCYHKMDMNFNPDDGLNGWLTVKDITDAPIHSDAERVYKILINGKDDEYFLIENRQQVGYDSYLPEEGIVIWHIDEAMPDNNAEQDPPHYRIWLEDAGNTASKTGAAWSSNDGQDEFGTSTTPNTDGYGGASGIRIYNISTENEEMTFKFGNETYKVKQDFGGSAPPDYTSLVNNVVQSHTTSGTGDEKMFGINIPSDADTFIVWTTVTPDEDILDIYLKMGSMPTTSDYDARGYTSSGCETIALPTATITLQSGMFYILVAGSGSG